jgi:hypothetical protein
MKFSELIKESFFDKNEIKTIGDVFRHKSSYKDKVAWAVNQIMMDTEGISEKSFKLLDELKINIENVFDKNRTEIESLIKDCQEKDYRVEYTAEKVYYDFFKKSE